MDIKWALQKIRINALFVNGALMALTLTACSQKKRDNVIPQDSVSTAPKENTVTREQAEDLKKIAEYAPSQGQLVWLNKEFWLDRKIWLSVGVERASVSGLAMSVIGYVPAQILRTGSSEIVLQRQSQGLFGGSALAPEMAINSYPIVSETAEAILVDISAPQVPYGLSVGGESTGSQTSEIQPELEYLKKLNVEPTRLSFESVISLRSSVAFYEPGDGSPEDTAGLDPHKLNLTLRTDWLLVDESPETELSYKPRRASSNLFGFFIDSTLVTDNGNSAQAFVNRININKAFQWEMSANTPVDFQETVKEGILSWNKSFEREALKVSLAKADRAYTDPSTSNIVWDDNEAIPMAFANWRSNPYTGEIMQAQIYLSGNMWLSAGQMTFRLRELEKSVRTSEDSGQAEDPDSMPPSADPTILARVPINAKDLKKELALLKKDVSDLQKAQNPRRLFVGLNVDMAREKMNSQSFCSRPLELGNIANQIESLEMLLNQKASQRGGSTPFPQHGLINSPRVSLNNSNPNAPVTEHKLPTHMPYPKSELSVQQFSKNVLRAVVMHELGHTLGLRHNFKGSTGISKGGMVESASIMDYNDLVVDAQFEEPGDYDKKILRAGYLNESQKGVPFCTDQDARRGLPECSMHDFSANTVEATSVMQEGNLLVAQQFFQTGQNQVGLSFISRALRTNISLLNTFLFPSMEGFLALKDPNFVDKQTQAWLTFKNAQAMLKVDFPATLVESYRQLLLQVLASRMNPDAAESVVIEQVLTELSDAAVDSATSMSLDTRLASLKGLQNVQSLTGRHKLKTVLATIQEKLEADKIPPLPPLVEATRPIEDIMEDEEVENAIQKILSSGYFK